MIATTKQIKILLLILILGVWGLLIRSFFPPPSASAGPTSIKRVFVVSSDKEGKLFYDNSAGTIAFSATGLLTVLDDAAKKGIKVHSVLSPSGLGGYVIFVER